MEGFRIKIFGEYIARTGETGKDRVVKNYECEAILPSMDSALSVIKNKILYPLLSKKYSDFISFRTYHIKTVQPLGPKSVLESRRIEIKYMDREALLDLISEKNLPVDPEYYPSLITLREAVELASEDPQGYIKRFERQKGDLELDRELAKLNPNLSEEAGIGEDFASDSTVQAEAPEPVLAQSKEPKKPRKKRDKSLKAAAGREKDRIESLRQESIRDKDIKDIPETGPSIDDL